MGVDDRFYDLASRYLDGATSGIEERELSDRLASDEGARREMARLVSQHGALRWTFVPAEGATPLSRPRPPRRRAWRRPERKTSPLVPWMAAAAAALFLVAVGAALSRPPARAPSRLPAVATRDVDPAPRPSRPDEAPLPPPAPRTEEPPRPAPLPLPAPAPSAPAAPTPRPVADAPPVPAVPAPTTTTEPGTQAAPAPVAVLDAVEGAAALGDAAAGAPLYADRELATPAGVRARVRYDDGTRIDLGPETAVVLSSRPGKHVTLRAGELAADVVRQPADRPFTLGTPHGDLRVLGTRFTVRVDPRETRLEVHEGRVRLARADGLAAVDVAAGFFAVAAPRTALAARPTPLARFRISFGPADGTAPPEYDVDDGSPFDERRGRGWSRDLRRNTRMRDGSAPALLRRHIGAGNAQGSDRWEIVVPNGRYAVALSCGDVMTAQGPHRVVVEGLRVVNDLMTAAGKPVLVDRAVVDVKDGRLTLELGAVGTTRTDPDGDTDTTLNWIVVQQLR